MKATHGKVFALIDCIDGVVTVVSDPRKTSDGTVSIVLAVYDAVKTL